MSVEEPKNKIELTAKHWLFIALFIVVFALLMFVRANTSSTELIANEANNQPIRNPTFQAKIDNFKSNESFFGTSTKKEEPSNISELFAKDKGEGNIAELIKGLSNKEQPMAVQTNVFTRESFMIAQEQALYESLTNSEYQVVNNVIIDNTNNEILSENPNNESQLPMGSIIHVVSRSENSNHYLGSPFFGMVSQDVYDFTNQKLLINKGASVVGHIDAVITDNPVIETKLGIVVEKIKRKDGSVINFEMAASDSDGLGGITGDVNKHSIRKWGGFSAFAILSSGLSLSAGDDKQAQSSSDLAMDRMKQQVSQSSTTAANQFLQIKPTVSIHTGDTFSVMIKDDILIAPLGDI